MEDGWLDFEDVVCFVAVNFLQCFGDDFGCGVTKLERWVVGWGAGREGVVVFLLWDCLAGFVSYCDEPVVQCVCDAGGVVVLLSFVDDRCG